MKVNSNKVKTDTYNQYVNIYNEEANKFNSLIERLEGDNTLSIPKKVDLYESVAEGSDLWKSNNEFYKDVDNINLLTEGISSGYFELCKKSVNDVVLDYNIVADEYNECIKNTSIDYILDMQNLKF